MPQVRVDIPDKFLNSLLFKTRAENIAKAIAIAVEEFLKKESIEKEELTKLVKEEIEKGLSELMNEFSSRVNKSLRKQLEAVRDDVASEVIKMIPELEKKLMEEVEYAKEERKAEWKLEVQNVYIVFPR